MMQAVTEKQIDVEPRMWFKSADKDIRLVDLDVLSEGLNWNPWPTQEQVGAGSTIYHVGASGRVRMARPEMMEKAWRPAIRRSNTSNSRETLRQRVANANRHFERKASEVFNDEAAVRLLARLYTLGIVEVEEFDPCKDGLALARLAAANFCEVGANVIHITNAGQRFIETIDKA